MRRVSMDFFHRLIQPDAVLMLFVAVLCLLGYGYPGFRERATVGLYWLIWLIVGILALVAWVLLVFS